jgi:hypothetical protein
VPTFFEFSKWLAAVKDQIGHVIRGGVRRVLEEMRVDLATAALKRVTGREPAGYRSPAAGLMPSTLDCLIERNFLYDSSMMGNDFSPYYCRVGDQAPADGPFIVLKVTPRRSRAGSMPYQYPGALRARPPNASSSRARHASSGSLGSTSEAARPTWSNCLSPGDSTTSPS